MSRQVMISDQLYNQLKELADKGYRSIAGQIAYLLQDKPQQTTTEVFKPAAPTSTGYPCCTKAAPCKHWLYDGVNEIWTNSLTGEIRNT